MDSLEISILNSSHIIKSCSKTNNASSTSENENQLETVERGWKFDKCWQMQQQQSVKRKILCGKDNNSKTGS